MAEISPSFATFFGIFDVSLQSEWLSLVKRQPLLLNNRHHFSSSFIIPDEKF